MAQCSMRKKNAFFFSSLFEPRENTINKKEGKSQSPSFLLPCKRRCDGRAKAKRQYTWIRFNRTRNRKKEGKRGGKKSSIKCCMCCQRRIVMRRRKKEREAKGPQSFFHLSSLRVRKGRKKEKERNRKRSY